MSDLKPEDQNTAAILEPLIGKQMMLMLYSKSPIMRTNGLRDFDHGLTTFPFGSIEESDRQHILVALFAVINKGCADDFSQVNLAAINLLVNTIQDHCKNFEQLDSDKHKLEFLNYVRKIVDGLLIKLNSKYV